MEELLQWVEYIEDVHQQSKVRHTLKDILVIVLFATLANADDWVEMALFADDYQDYLRKYIELRNGPPSHDTLRRVMGMVSPEILQQLYGKWQELLMEKPCVPIRVMGKSRPISFPHGAGGGRLQSGTKSHGGKSNEITAIPELLDKIQIRGQIVTIDAMGTQTAIAEKIKGKRAGYVLALKGNQGTLYEDVKEYFGDSEFLGKIMKKGNYKKTQEKGHGQIETREYYQTEDIRWLERKKNWKGLKNIIIEKKTLEKEVKRREEYRYFISSIKEDIELAGRAVRGNWSIESMHWHPDVTFREDANRTIDKMAVQNLNIIKKWSLSILKTAEVSRQRKLSMRKKRYVIGLRPIKHLEEVLNA